MISTILLDAANVLVPIFAIAFVFSIPIIAIVYYYRQRFREMDERKLMIEKGIVPPPLEKSRKRNRRRKALEDGLNLLAIGIGLLVGFWLESTFDLPRLFAIGGSILLMLGVANVLIVILSPKLDEKDED